MKKIFIASICFSILASSLNAQKVEDLFKSSDVKVTWLGLDFSHVKLIGDFSQVQGAGDQSHVQIKNSYFPAWNHLVLNEQKKYDIKGMLKKENIQFDIDMIMEINGQTPVESMEAKSYSTPDYKLEDINKFVKEYKLEGKSGIGIAFIVESFNKVAQESYIHFVALNMSTKEILIHQRIKGKPAGFGLRNYWAGAIYNTIKQIRDGYYKEWKNKYA